jgi:CheY-like chemotaxis protein/predicted transcriptional regulator
VTLSSEVMKRILSSLLEDEKMKKTNLAGRAKINYGMCVKYAKFLEKMGWIEIRPEQGINDGNIFEYLSLTSQGRKTLEVLNSYDNQDKNGNNGNNLEDETPPSQFMKKISRGNYVKTHSAFMNDKLVIPSSFSASMMENHHSLEPGAKRKKNANIMIIDDDKDILLTYNFFLLSYGYHVKTFSDPVEALKHFTQNSLLYDLLILDIRMPHVNGIQLFQIFKSINRNVKVMFVSCLDAAPELVSIFSELTHDVVLTKPILAEPFVNAVKRILN